MGLAISAAVKAAGRPKANLIASLEREASDLEMEQIKLLEEINRYQQGETLSSWDLSHMIDALRGYVPKLERIEEQLTRIYDEIQSVDQGDHYG